MPPKGSKLSIEQKRNISEKLKGHSVSAETRLKLRICNLGKIYSEAAKEKRRRYYTDEIKQKLREKFVGKKLSEEHRRKITAAQTGLKRTEEARRKISEGKIGRKNPMWKGGEYISSTGYVMVRTRNHPNKTKHDDMPKHRLIMSQLLGRSLNEIEVVHHINGIRSDNDPDNLTLFPNVGEHTRYHLKGKKKKKRASRL